MTTGQGLAIIGFWIPLCGAYIGNRNTNFGVFLATGIGVVGTVVSLLAR